MQLGAFSVSLAVKDLATSRAFYEALGFSVTGGDAAQNWLVLRNNGIVVGLFQGMFEGNLLTFNPGWDQHKQELASFQDVREIQAELDAKGIELALRTDPDGQGTGYLQLADPDGNVILIDQHVARPTAR
ncbi:MULTISPECIES: VOC family protein [Stenotrophomonas]|uniref:VOC family protein n=1 Tax=Stenotrophomonas lactitubi TaxID=2045214 RepID=A0AAW4GM99_9GAMM|nr:MULTISPECIES: VOC family protein [Stenotrophomonas]MBM9915883.1 VOC family protein [Stenotrophomonas lactitubi]MBM9924390.1 VOC family protein [Stenotrophomonas lactitubi]MBM9937330.1 VOC family protein [Stenotrophomonas lactitubi]